MISSEQEHADKSRTPPYVFVKESTIERILFLFTLIIFGVVALFAAFALDLWIESP